MSKPIGIEVMITSGIVVSCTGSVKGNGRAFTNEELAELVQSKESFIGLKKDYDKIRRRLTNHAKYVEKTQGCVKLIEDATNLISRCDDDCLDWIERAHEWLESYQPKEPNP